MSGIVMTSGKCFGAVGDTDANTRGGVTPIDHSAFGDGAKKMVLKRERN